ncbi:flagellar protein FlaG [Shewanella sp. MF05960]|uniref:flagellar protein FlaG n=1 Tax=Shewanella sp. MF05960 TaxID=3434874 RepID=UPI003D7AF9ED
MMEVNNTVQFTRSSEMSKNNISTQPVLNEQKAEKNKVNELSSVSDTAANDKFVQEAEQEVDKAQLQQVASDLTNMVAMMQKGLKFSVDDASGKQVIKVQDVSSGDIIRQIPSEEALKLAEKLSEVSGILMKIEV